jgi:hypothetical protein
MAHTREQPASRVRPMPERLAGAPISWGPCEVPAWGRMPEAETVLAEIDLRRPRGTVLHARHDQGSDGWLVLEQDTAITADEPAVDSGALRDAAESIAFINSAQTEEINR